MPVLRKTVRNVMESEDASTRAHRREAVRVSPVRGDVQAESSFAEAFVLGASEHHQLAGVGRPLQVLLLHAVLRHAPGARATLVRPPQQLAAEQESP